jgi:hypothetical protein
VKNKGKIRPVTQQKRFKAKDQNLIPFFDRNSKNSSESQNPYLKKLSPLLVDK